MRLDPRARRAPDQPRLAPQAVAPQYRSWKAFLDNAYWSVELE